MFPVPQADTQDLTIERDLEIQLMAEFAIVLPKMADAFRC